MSVTLTLNLTKGTPITTDHPNQIAEIAHCDCLAIHLQTGWAAGDGITRVDFSHDEASKNAGGNSPFYWTPGGANRLGNVFGLSTSTNSAGNVTTLTIQHTENVSNDDPWWYKITAGGKVLDPELINKSGTGSTGWVNKPAKTAARKRPLQRSPEPPAP